MLPYKGTVDIDGKVINWQTTFDQSVKFKCIRCGLSCIGADVQLTEKEIEKIKSVTEKEFYEEYTTPFGNMRRRLKKINNRCIFLDDKLNCTIYQNRPLLCREYPFKVLFTAKNTSVIDTTLHCSCIIKKEFTKENEVDFGQLVKDHYLNSPEDAEDVELFNEIVQNVKKNLDSPEAVKKCWNIIIEKLVSPLELCALMANFQDARDKITRLNFSNVDNYISSALKNDCPETDWEAFMKNFLAKISGDKTNFVGLETATLKKYNMLLQGDKIEFSCHYTNEKIILSPDSIQRKIISKEGLEILKEFMQKFWDRAVTNCDFYLVMDYLKEKTGRFLPSITIQLDAARFALHCFEFFLHIISEKNKHEDITADDVKETILILDGAFLTVTSSIMPKI